MFNLDRKNLSDYFAAPTRGNVDRMLRSRVDVQACSCDGDSVLLPAG